MIHSMGDYYRILALDYGEVRIGIAMTDVMRIIANGFENYTRVGLKKDIEHIQNIVNENNVKVIVIGLPLNMDGSDSKQTLKTREFGVQIAKALPNVKIDFLDERLTSARVEKMLINADVSRDKRKKVLDKLSATIILQDYLKII